MLFLDKMSSGFKIGIIGSEGLIGSWLKRLFEQWGCELTCSDLNTKVKNIEVVSGCDIIFIAVPLKGTETVIESLKNSFSSSQLLIDCASVKLKIIRKLKETPCDILSIHPMFAPYAENLSGERIIVCKQAESEKTDFVLNTFIKAGFELTYSDPNEHDRIMGIIQGITHFSSLALILALKNYNLPIEKTLAFASPIYKIRLALAGRILMQDPNLYHGIFTDNSFCLKSIQKYLQDASELQDIISGNDENEFRKIFTELKNYLAGFAPQAKEESERLLEFSRAKKVRSSLKSNPSY